MGDKYDCNHRDMGTLRIIDAPTFFTVKYRENLAKHFPTKCANCKIGFQDCLSRRVGEYRGGKSIMQLTILSMRR
jgi:hypothetical protein